jgi:hypothetical protein
MTNVNVWAVAVAALAGFVVSSIWYSVFGLVRARHLGADPDELNRPVPWKMLVELARTLLLTVAFAGLAGQLDVTTWSGSVVLGLVLWLGFPALILTGSVLWDSVSWQLAAVHTGDWLAKLVVIATVVGVWH